MKITLAVRRMLSMCPDAWYIFIRMIQLVAFMLFCAFMLLLECTGRMGRNYTLYFTAMSLNETAQSLLMLAFILSVCVEDIQS